MIADMELDSPPGAVEPDTKRVKMIGDVEDTASQMALSREKLLESRPSVSTTASILPEDAFAHRLKTLEMEALNQHAKHEELKSTAQQLVTALGTAIRRLEDNAVQQDHRTSAHEHVLASQHLLREQLRQQATLPAAAQRMSGQESMQSSDRLLSTEQQVNNMMQHYQALQQQLTHRQLTHEEETMRLRNQGSELQRPPTGAETPPPSAIPIRLADMHFVNPHPPPRPCPPGIPTS